MNEKDRLHLCCEDFDSLNEVIKNKEVADHIEAAIKNV